MRRIFVALLILVLAAGFYVEHRRAESFERGVPVKYIVSCPRTMTI